MDTFSETDPFVTLKIGNKEFRTATLDNAGCSPQWREDFIFELEPGQSQLLVTLYDADDNNKELIGSLTVNFVEELKTSQNNKFEKRYVLEQGKLGRDNVNRPSIFLMIEKAQGLRSANVASVGILSVWLMSGTDILDPAVKSIKASSIVDPYVLTSIGNHTFRSKTCSRTKDPVWNEKMRFLIDTTSAEGVLRFSVYDYDVLSTDDFVCSYEQKVSDLIAQVKSAHSALSQGAATQKYGEVAFSVDLLTNAEGGRRKNGTLSFKASFEEYAHEVQGFYQYWFELLDLNKDGGLDRTEFQGFISQVSSKELAQPELDELFARIDADGSGRLDRQEVARYFSTQLGAEFLDAQIFMTWMAERDKSIDMNLSKARAPRFPAPPPTHCFPDGGRGMDSDSRKHRRSSGCSA